VAVLLKLAWRNLWRHRRRTLLTVAAIGLGLAVLITMVSFVAGLQEMMVEQVARSSVGHVQLHHPEYRARRAVDLVLPQASALLAAVEATPGVRAASARLIFTGALRSSTSSAMPVVQILAVDATREAPFSILADHVVRGGFLVKPPEALAQGAPPRVRDRKGILMGVKLARALKVDLGSKVRVETAGFEGATTAAAFYVSGLLETGSDLIDRQLVLVPLADMQALTGAGDAAHEISVLVDGQAAIPDMLPALRATARRHQAPGAPLAEVLPWWEVAPDVRRMIDLLSLWNAIVHLLMLVILSAGILTTMFMVVLERRHEFGVQLALGTRPFPLFVGVMLEALLVAVLAVATGLAVGALAVWALVTHGIDLRWLIGGYSVAGLLVSAIYYGSWSAHVFYEPAAVVFVGTIVMALWPALRVARMKALDAIRQGGAS
jgi:ABC-type lipoprotein release transport system permease subunit